MDEDEFLYGGQTNESNSTQDQQQQQNNATEIQQPIVKAEILIKPEQEEQLLFDPNAPSTPEVKLEQASTNGMQQLDQSVTLKQEEDQQRQQEEEEEVNSCKFWFQVKMFEKKSSEQRIFSSAFLINYCFNRNHA